MKKPQKPYWEMNVEELRAATAEFDAPFVESRSRPMTAAERAQWERAKRKRGRPRIGKGAEVISVSVEQDLLAASDRFAKKHGLSRSALISRLLRQAVGSSPSPAKPARPARRASSKAAPRKPSRKAA